MRYATVALLLTWATTVLAGGVGFSHRPEAGKNGDSVTIRFAVSAPTDVAVFIEDSKGEVVRHLVAGVLGQNPPAPLKPGLLPRAIEWSMGTHLLSARDVNGL